MQIARKTAVTQGENPFHISGSRQDAEFALREAERWLRPLPEKELRQALVALHVKTVSARAGEMDLNLMLEIYLAELKAYPGDVVRDVLQNWPGKFFPAWVELKEAITGDRRVRERRQRIAALRAFIDGDGPRELGVKNPVTDAQIEHGKAYIKHLRGLEGGDVYSDERLERLAAVDEKLGDKAKAPDRDFKSIDQLRRESGFLKTLAKKSGLKVSAH